MFRPNAKFSGEQDDRHQLGPQEKLYWTNHGIGIPFRGSQVPILGPGELDELPIARYPQVSLFDLSVQDDLQAYLWVRDRIENNLFLCTHIERHWDAERKCMLIYMEWSQLYRIAPKGFRDNDYDRGNSSVHL
jgi:hypothetical protein